MYAENIITERLILRPLSMDDLEGMFELDSNTEVVKYVGTPPLKSKAESKAVIEFIQRQYEELGVGRLAVLLKDTEEFIGWAGLKLFTAEMNGHQHFFDVGYRFIPSYWGKGYATEACKASIRLGFEVYKAEKICAIAMKKNIASHNVLIKSGLKFINEFEMEGDAINWYETHEPI
jgi:[ribosomal protein S5]-alanine N-acetyltransferase